MPDIGPVHHIGLTVSDRARSVAFYRDLLGCTEIKSYAREGGYFAEIVGYPEASVLIAHLRVPDGDLVIELTQYLAPAPVAADLEPARIGNAHICFRVPDLDQTYSRLQTANVQFISAGPVVSNTDPNPGGGFNPGSKTLYMKDPDGIVLELSQAGGGITTTPRPGTI